jgi:3-oxoadipate enol-lactonase
LNYSQEFEMPVLQLDDVDLNYDVQGEGPAMLFCSATATHGEVWKLCQVPDFSRDHKVITFDQRGTGKSPFKVPLDQEDFSTVRLTADAAVLLDRLKVRSAIILGHSNGGRVAQQLALDRPDLVQKIVLLSSGSDSSQRGLPLSICKKMVEQGYGPYVRNHCLENGFTKSYIEKNPAEVERFLAVRLANPAPVEIFFRHVLGRQEFDLGARINDIKVPALIVVGEHEDHGASGPTHLASAKLLSQNLPNARLIVLKDQGHYYYFSDSERLNGAIREFMAQ